MTQKTARANWLIPASLILLALVPSIAGVARLADLASGQATAASARFFAAPLPVVLHILGATYFGLVGALQFSPALRRRNRWHRISGRLVVPAGLLAALSGLWMTLTYPWANADGEAVYLARLIFGAAMAVSLVLGVTTILKGNVQAHRAWMLRGYAIGMAAGTQVFTHLPWFLLVGTPSEGPRAVMMISAWVINLAVAEWLIRRTAARPTAAPTTRLWRGTAPQVS
jgi:uncharacterized membrane protein